MDPMYSMEGKHPTHREPHLYSKLPSANTIPINKKAADHGAGGSVLPFLYFFSRHAASSVMDKNKWYIELAGTGPGWTVPSASKRSAQLPAGERSR